jgi:Uma2 family endonuclease
MGGDRAGMPDMSNAPRKPMTIEEFLAREAQQPLRYEFDGYQPVAMAGGTEQHSIIQGNLPAALVGRLRGRPCRYHGSDLKVDTGHTIRYPDGFVVCSLPVRSRTQIADPVVIFEVMSDSSARTDLVTKN